MAKTITITVPGNTTVAVPASGTLRKSPGGTVTIGIANESGQAITLGAAGTATAFTVGAVPASIADGASDEIELTLDAEGDVDFNDGEEATTVSVIFAANPPFHSAARQVAGPGSASGQVRGGGSAAGQVAGAGSVSGQAV